MRIQVPAEKVDLENAFPVGWHKATCLAATEGEDAEAGAVVLKWRFRALGRSWTKRRAIRDPAELGNAALACGLSGEIDIADFVGCKAMIRTKTTGGKTGWRISDYNPVES